MDIAALSINLNQQKLMQQISIAVTKEAMEFQQQTAEQLVETIDAVHPTLGQNIDISI